MKEEDTTRQQRKKLHCTKSTENTKSISREQATTYQWHNSVIDLNVNCKVVEYFIKYIIWFPVSALSNKPTVIGY